VISLLKFGLLTLKYLIIIKWRSSLSFQFRTWYTSLHILR